MHVIVLGGQSLRQQDWVREVRETLESAGFPVVLHDYAHWLQGDEKIDFEKELALIAAFAAELDDTYLIVAKSIGCVLTAVGVARGLLNPKGCVLLGLPLKIAETSQEFATGLASLPMTIFVQKEHDPFGSYKAVRSFARPIASPATLFIPLAGNDHNYTDFELLAALTLRLQKAVGVAN